MKLVVSILFLCSVSVLFGQSQITELGELPTVLRETSGLISYNDVLITHNDSGNLPELYELDKNTLAITRVVTVTNAVNIDWEDIAQDDAFIYIGDIGNNNGSRTDLRILKISKADYDTSDAVTAEVIAFSYEDQTDFTATPNSDFDAEALIVLDNDLLVFTKQWQAMGTDAYRIPKTPGVFEAPNIGSYQVDGLVTGATINQENSNAIYLIGYSQFLFPFFVALTPNDTTAIFDEDITRTNFTIGAAQVESIAFNATTATFYFTSEEFINPPIIDTKARLFSFSLDDDNEEEENEEEEEEEEGIQEEPVILFKTFGADRLNYSVTPETRLLAISVFDEIGRLLLRDTVDENDEAFISIASFSQGVYQMTFFFENQRITKTFIKD